MLVTVATVRAMVRSAIPVGLDFKLLGRSFEVASELGQITMELPRVERVGDRPNTLPPTRAGAIHPSSFSDHLFAQSDIYRWGSVAEWRAAGPRRTSRSRDSPVSAQHHGMAHQVRPLGCTDRRAGD